METARRTLETASDLITGSRQESHGAYSHEAERIGIAWGALLDLPESIPPRTVAAMMVVLKMMRATAGRENPDDWVDGAGYCALGSQIDHDRVQVWA